MGTYYNIRYVSHNQKVTKSSLDSLLVELNNQVSTYIPDSDISVLNTSQVGELAYAKKESEHFIENYVLSKEIFDLTTGHFDPTLNPLVNFWGFGYDKKASEDKDVSKISEFMQYVGFGKWSDQWASKDSFVITKPIQASLDFSAVAKGYGVDLVGDFLESKNIKNYFVDIGGEATAMGAKPENNPWVLGLNTPLENAKVQDAIAYIKLENNSIATSGNYRNFYEEDGVKYSHTINPFTGFPERSELLSTSIIHKDCSRADAMTTSCMVMGLEKAKILIESLPEYEALFIYNDNDSLAIDKTSGFVFELK